MTMSTLYRRGSEGRGALRITIRRDALLEDALHALGGVGSAIKCNLHVTFIGEHGGQEAGIDQGGLQKEFMEEVRPVDYCI